MKKTYSRKLSTPYTEHYQVRSSSALTYSHLPNIKQSEGNPRGRTERDAGSITPGQCQLPARSSKPRRTQTPALATRKSDHSLEESPWAKQGRQSTNLIPLPSLSPSSRGSWCREKLVFLLEMRGGERHPEWTAQPLRTPQGFSGGHSNSTW